METSVLILSYVILGLNPVLPVLHIYIYCFIMPTQEKSVSVVQPSGYIISDSRTRGVKNNYKHISTNKYCLWSKERTHHSKLYIFMG